MIEEHKSLSEKFIKKWVWLYLFSFLLAPLGYIVKIIVSYDLSVEDIWVIYWVLSFVTLLSSLNDFGLTESLNYFLPKFITEKRYDKVKWMLLYTIWIQFLTWLIIAGILFFGSNLISQIVFKDPSTKNILEIFSIYFIGINIFQVFNTFFVSIQNTLYYKSTEFFRMIFTLLFTIYFFTTHKWSSLHYASSWVLSVYVWIFLSFGLFYISYYRKYLKNSPTYLSKEFFKEIFKYAIVVLLWAQAGTILSQVDMQMIIYFLGTKAAWYYSNYLSIVTIPFLIIWPILSFLFPVISQLYGQEDYLKIKAIKSLFLKVFIIIWISCNLLFLVFAKPIAFILFWQKFIESGVILKYSILLLSFNFLLQINFNILAWMGKVKERLKIISQAIILNIITNYILMMLFWVYWASLATWLGWLYIWIQSERVLGKEYSTNIDYKNLFKNLIVFWVISIWIYFSYLWEIKNFIDIWRTKSLFLLSIIILLWISITLWINGKETKNFLNEIEKVRKS